MFKELGAMAGLLGNAGKLQQAMGQMQEAVGQITATGEAGGGLVSVTVSGKFEVTACKVSADALKLNDPEMLGDLFVAAANAAAAKVRERLAAESGKLAGVMGLPPGMLGGGLPGFGG